MPTERLNSKVTARRVVGIVGISVAAGGVMGAIAAILCTPIGAPFGLVGGAVVGLILSPALVLALARKPLPLAVPLVVGPALAAAIMGGIATSPAVAMLSSVVVFVGMAFVAKFAMEDRRASILRGWCAKCGYEVGTLARCPECGLDVDTRPDAIAPPLTPQRRWIALSLFIVVVIPALGWSITAAYERHRTRSTAELIEQLGDNDMQLQWEAQHELSKQGTAPLIKALSHPKAAVRRNAAWALESFQDPAAREDLKRLLNDPDSWTREHAKKAFDRLPPE